MDRYNIGTYKDLKHSTLETSIEISAEPYEVEIDKHSPHFHHPFDIFYVLHGHPLSPLLL